MSLVLNWIKAHWIVVVLGAVIVLSLPAGFVLGENMNGSVRQAIDSRVRSQNSSLDKVSKTTVQIEPLLPGVPTFDRQMVVSPQVLEQYRAVRESIKNDAAALITEAIEINKAGKEEQLVPGLLPEPAPGLENELPYQVHDAYVKAHEDLLADIGAGEGLDAETLALALEDFESTYRRAQLNREPGEPLELEERDRLREAMTTRRMIEYRQHAENTSIYADMDMFNLAQHDMSRGKPSPDKWFDWQHDYWVDADLMAAIRNANTDEDSGRLANVAGANSAVVKRILSINRSRMYQVVRKQEDPYADADNPDAMGFGFGEGGFEGGSFEGGPPVDAMGKGGGGKFAAPSAPSSRGPAVVDNSDPTRPFEDDFSASISGRTTNPLYDVRNVDMQLIVDSNRIPELLHAINSTNFNTVTGMSIQSINVLDHLAQGYYYGNDPVVQLNLTIETIWLREWIEPVMPTVVKDSLGISDEAANDADSDSGGEFEEGGGRGEFDMMPSEGGRG